MSGIAEVLANLGYTVTGSDVADSANVKRLRDKGIKVLIGHDAKNIADGADVIVVVGDQARQSRAPRTRAQRRPVVRRDVAELMRPKSRVAIAGTHGKTTTTSLVAVLLDAGGFDPTVINGGIINAYGTNARPRPAIGWWSKPTNPMAPSSSCRPISRSSPTSTPSISITSRRLPPCRRPSALSWRTCRSMGSR